MTNHDVAVARACASPGEVQRPVHRLGATGSADGKPCHDVPSLRTGSSVLRRSRWPSPAEQMSSTASFTRTKSPRHPIDVRPMMRRADRSGTMAAMASTVVTSAFQTSTSTRP